jgi:ABC-2 type transport system ATP-binding protein
MRATPVTYRMMSQVPASAPIQRVHPVVAESPAIVTLADVEFEYPQFHLGPLSLTVAAGHRQALVGPNGAGKSTLLALIAGQRTPTRGAGRVLGHDLRVPDPRIRQHVALVTADALALRWMTVRAHFGFIANFYDGWREQDALSLAARLNLPLDVPIQDLSRGNALKAGLCSAWGQGAELLLLDEPTAGLDPGARLELLEQLNDYLSARPQIAIVYATHVLEDLDYLHISHLLVLRHGKPMHIPLSERGSPAAASTAARRVFEESRR